ncbi:MAG: hypothetical protein Q8S26_03620 [Azonexus sp.]|nr:hypothetical protein [Azonexus sp.]
MKRLLAWLAGTLLLLVLAAGGLLLLALDSQPLVSRSETISPNSVAQARWLFDTNDPRRLRAGEARRTAIPAPLIDEGVNYIATRFLHGRGALVMGEKSAEIRLTLRPPLLPGEHFLNLRATLQEAEGEPRIASARIGSLPVPPALLELILASGIRLAGYDKEWNLARHAIRELKFDTARRRVIVGYVWEPALLERARSIAVNPADLVRFRSAQETLAGLLDHKASGAKVVLPEVLGPMLSIDGDDQRENRRAALFILAAYLAEKDLASLIPEAANWPRPRPVMLSLHGRYDSAQHFIISATLAAWAGEPIADAIGLYKELNDARHGSGFSFADLAADRAGTAFGELIVSRPAPLNRLLDSRFSDADLAPALADLPEFLHEKEFRLRFGGPGSPAYQKIFGEIERRLFALPLYRPARES